MVLAVVPTANSSVTELIVTFWCGCGRSVDESEM